MSIPIAERTQFKVGKYDVVARPIPGFGHMLRVTRSSCAASRSARSPAYPRNRIAASSKKPPTAPNNV